jgi:hypothetical protein
MLKYTKWFFVIGCLFSLTEAQAEDVAAVQAANAPAIELAIKRGELLYAYDQAAWHVTDAMRKDVKNISGTGMRGYVMTPEKNGIRVTFFGLKDETPYGIYTAVWEYGDGKMHKTQISEQPILLKVMPVVSDRRRLRKAKDQVLSANQIRLIADRQLVLDSLERGNKDYVWQCTTGRVNVAVLPREQADDPDLVYITTAQVDNDIYPFGGHFRFMVRDGQIVDRRAFTNSCVNLSSKNEDGSQVAQVIVSHLLDPVPTEIHVFNKLAMHLPVGVGTTQNNGIWAIEKLDGRTRIRYVGVQAPSEAAKP